MPIQRKEKENRTTNGGLKVGDYRTFYSRVSRSADFFLTCRRPLRERRVAFTILLRERCAAPTIALRQCYAPFTTLLRGDYDIATGILRRRYGEDTIAIRRMYDDFTMSLSMGRKAACHPCWSLAVCFHLVFPGLHSRYLYLSVDRPIRRVPRALPIVRLTNVYRFIR